MDAPLTTSLFGSMFRTKPMQVINAEEHSEDLPRSLSLFDLICIGIGGTVGSGIFSTAGSIISATAGPAAVISWLIGGVVCCFNALAYMELTTRIPSSGSTYAYAYHALGELPAVIAGWLLTLEYAVSGAGVARSWADKVEEWILIDHPNANVDWLNMKYGNILAALIQALSVVVLLMGVRFGKAFVNTITIIKLAVVLFIIIVGFTAISSDNLSPFVPERRDLDGTMAFGTQGIITGATQAFFGYIGFDEVCCLAAEAKNPKKIMPIAVISVVFGTMILSVLSSLVLSGMVPYLEATSFPEGFAGVGYHWAEKIVRAGETCTMPVVVLIAFLAQPRLNYALACDGLMPKIFSKVNESGNLFINTLITGIFFTGVAFVVPFITLWDIVNFGILVSFILSNASLLMIRTKEASPSLAPKLIGAIVFFGCLSAFFYQRGYADGGDSVACLVISIITLVGMVASMAVLYVKCPQAGNDPNNFTAPLVPFIPTICIWVNFYFVSQISDLGLGLGCGWVGLAILSYLLYGFKNAAGRNGWHDLMRYQLDDTSFAKNPSMSEVRPSMNSLLKE